MHIFTVSKLFKLYYNNIKFFLQFCYILILHPGHFLNKKDLSQNEKIFKKGPSLNEKRVNL